MKAGIRQRALELGFDDCRFTTAAPPATAAQYQDWLAGKHHGEMAWLERNAEKRVDPQKVLPGAKSVIVLAASYEAGDKWQVTSDEKPPGSESQLSTLNPVKGVAPTGLYAPQLSTGLIARYARFADYHDVLGERLKSLSQFVNQLGDAPTKSLWYVDTGPLLERDLAQRAGLGFVGKHTNLISRRLGNWIFLSEIITTLELEPDAPEKNHCGNCTRCITACPTNAIPAPFQLDARRCISYLTIELKGAIPVELRPAIGNRIYGCDDCLAACPWNRFAREGRMMKAHVREDLQTPDLLELLQLDNAGFKSRFAGSPILRTKRRGLLRNVCVALGNTGDASALPALEKAAHDTEPLIAEHAKWAISEIQTRQSNEHVITDGRG
ncbi:MAG TPA: tRNA epoxyqueuosine(34) reductase QueG [Verrucomicrobiae bacterium]|nr:tRNA epoxyqueuosine(34) reductase QueG [Verrucomicrobiae bacterium]